ncbi:MAG: glutamine--fructose-6-phosphate transaminase (isomerizing) [Acidimicrobiales bacterium]
MCGIIGMCGSDVRADVIVEGLHRLEYRGYDSAGLAVALADEIRVAKFAEKTTSIDELGKWVSSHPSDETLVAAIGHTRWATHGRPAQHNAHPMVDCSGRIAVVHNGIVENYRPLKAALIDAGHEFRSDTDTEVIVHLLEDAFAHTPRLESALEAVFGRLEGAMAIVALSLDDPGRIAIVRRMAPLVIGESSGQTLVASDIPALLGRAERFFAVPEETVVVLSGSGAITTGTNPLESMSVEWDREAAEHVGFPDFMSKEIFEQPRAVEDTLASREFGASQMLLDELHIDPDLFKSVNKVFLVACGTSYHAAMVAKYAIEHFCHLPVEIDISSEFRYRDPIVDPATLVIGVSQSGETLDTLTAIAEAKAMGARTLVVCNVIDASMARMADAVLYTHAGPEIGVAATKTHVAQIAALELIALYLASVRRTLYPAEVEELAAKLHDVPQRLAETLQGWDDFSSVADRLVEYERFYFIGRHVGYPVALEAALKLKEITYLPAEGYPAGELKHGPIAMIDEQSVVVAIATRTNLYDKILANVEEVRARGAKIVLVTNEGLEGTGRDDLRLIVPQTHQLYSPMLDVVPLQALAYRLAIARGLNPDKPRNLAKTVTVE